jgi:chemotaxis protein CheX
MLHESEIGTFVQGVTNYFETTVQQAAQVGVPFLSIGAVPECGDYTGMISISGRRTGVVYFTALRGMLTVMLMRMQETDTGHANLCDLVGEVANTISGNARRDFGKDFVISVPSVVHGRSAPLEFPAGATPFVVPINWRSHAAKLIVCLK